MASWIQAAKEVEECMVKVVEKLEQGAVISEAAAKMSKTNVVPEAMKLTLDIVTKFTQVCTVLAETAELPAVNPRAWLDNQEVKFDTLEDFELIQKGGFGDIYQGWSKKWGLQIALKKIRVANRDAMKELLMEANMMKLANFPYVLRLLGLCRNREGNFEEYGLVMEYMPNGSICTLFKSIPDVPWALRFQILHHVALGMNYLHSLVPPLLHLDLKPNNVLLDKFLNVRLADFGLSKLKNMAGSSKGENIGGTLPYAPPEALCSSTYVPKEPFDVYSYGIFIWAVLAAEEPYQNADPELIKLLVPQGQRPDVTKLATLDHINMVPIAKGIMIQCWAQEPKNRAHFSDTIVVTKMMHDSYKNDLDEAVRHVQDMLKDPTRGEHEDADVDIALQEETERTESSEMLHPSYFCTR